MLSWILPIITTHLYFASRFDLITICLLYRGELGSGTISVKGCCRYSCAVLVGVMLALLPEHTPKPPNGFVGCLWNENTFLAAGAAQVGVWPTLWWGCGTQGGYAWHLQAVPAITCQITSLTWSFDSTSLAHRGASESYWGPSLLWMVYRVFLTTGAIFLMLPLGKNLKEEMVPHCRTWDFVRYPNSSFPSLWVVATQRNFMSLVGMTGMRAQSEGKANNPPLFVHRSTSSANPPQKSPLMPIVRNKLCSMALAYRWDLESCSPHFYPWCNFCFYILQKEQTGPLQKAQPLHLAPSISYGGNNSVYFTTWSPQAHQQAEGCITREIGVGDHSTPERASPRSFCTKFISSAFFKDI